MQKTADNVSLEANFLADLRSMTAMRFAVMNLRLGLGIVEARRFSVVMVQTEA